ncbi:MAG: RagB/SusD family nutrient uptake outer membrane protein [Cytophagales bacterium]|nr:RagB/SusD family nutrient uptake outer membrane protein [Cytophagales bacterium]
MKKNFVKIGLLALTLLGLPFACADRLDIVPFLSQPSDTGLKTEGDLVGLLIGAYDGIQDTDSYGGDILLLSDIWSNRAHLRFRGTFAGLSQIANVNTLATSSIITTDNAWARDMWANAYRTINMTNLILENLSLSQGLVRPTNTVQGEALFIRGSLYFELARLYGRTWQDGDPNQNLAVPLVLTSSPFQEDKLTDANLPPRATVAQIYAQAKADLTTASTLLPNSNKQYATKWAALAQLSRIALMQGDYAAALDAANQVINSGVYSLAPLFGDLWFNFINFDGFAPKEYVFYMRMTVQDGTNGLNTYYGQTVSSIPGTAGRGDLDVQTPFVNLHERFSVTSRALTGNVATLTTSAAHNFQVGQTVYVTNLDATFNGTYIISAVTSNTLSYSKINADVSVASSTGNATADVRGTYFTVTNRRLTNKHLDRFGHVPVIRLAEMYLTRAEANFRLGSSVGDSPLNDVNRIRARVNLAPLVLVDLAAILKERSLELAFEGQRLHDIKRTQGRTLGSSATTPNGPFWNSPKLILPIPLREIEVNKKLVQNEGYQ